MLKIDSSEIEMSSQNIALSRYNKMFLSEFSERFASNKLKNEFFNALVQFIVDITTLDYAFVAQFKEEQADKFTLETIAFSTLGKLVENFDYSVIDGPCREVVYGTLHTYAENARASFRDSFQAVRNRRRD